MISFRVTSEVLSGGVNPLLRPLFAVAKRLANTRLSAGLTEITGWMRMPGEDLLKTAGTFAPLYKALQTAVCPRHGGLEDIEPHSDHRFQRHCRPVIRSGYKATAQSLSSSSSSGESKSSENLQDTSEDGEEVASLSGMPHTEPLSQQTKLLAVSPSTTGSSIHSPPHKRGRHKSPS